LDPFAKIFVLQAGARQHGDEATAGAIDVIHVLARTQLGIGDVGEVGPTRHGAQRVPCLDVGAGIAGVAVAAAKRHGNTAVSVHRQNERELLEIGMVGLRVAVGYRWRRASADLAPKPHGRRRRS
jgi:hypothetical protein